MSCTPYMLVIMSMLQLAVARQGGTPSFVLAYRHHVRCTGGVIKTPARSIGRRGVSGKRMARGYSYEQGRSTSPANKVMRIEEESKVAKESSASLRG